MTRCTLANSLRFLVTVSCIALVLSGPVCGAELTLEPIRLEFGTTGVNTPVPLSLTMRNTGTTDLTVTDYQITGADASLFTVSPGGPTPCASPTPAIPAGGSCSLAVTFTPVDTGIKGAALTVVSNAPTAEVPLEGVSDEPTVTLTVTGTGNGSLTFATPTSLPLCSSTCSHQFPVGTQLVITSVAGQNSAFSGWEGCPNETNGQCTVSLTRDTHLLAHFSDTTPNPGTLRLALIPIPNVTFNRVAVSPLSPQVVIAAGISGIYRTDDDFLHYSASDGRIFAPVVFDPVDTSRVYAGSSYVLSPYGYIHTSIDGGITFSYTPIGSVAAIAVDPTDHQSVYVGTNAGIYRKEGGTWQPLPTTGLTSTSFNALVFDRDGILYAGTWGGGVYFSQDRGNSWTHLEVNGKRYINLIAVSPHDPATIFVISDNGSFVSRNGGGSWTPLTTSYGSFTDFEFVPDAPYTVYAALGASGIYRSLDLGATWSRVAQLGDCGDVALVPGTSPIQLYAVGDNEGKVVDEFLYRSEPLGLAVSPGKKDFGTVGTHNASQTQAITLSNNSSDTAVTVNSLALNGGGAGEFRIEAGLTNPCAPFPHLIAAGESCTASLVFDPATIGRKGATLVVHSDDSAYPLLGIPLSGYGTAPPPTGSITIQETVVSLPTATALFSAVDETGTRLGMKLRTSTNGGRSWTAWEEFVDTKNVSLPTGDGPKTLYVQYLSAAGVVSKPSFATVTLETKPPVTTITPLFSTSVIDGCPTTASPSADFRFTADEPVNRFECSLDGGQFDMCLTPKGYSALSIGSHTLLVRGVDTVNVTGNAARYDWSIVAAIPQYVKRSASGQPDAFFSSITNALAPSSPVTSPTVMPRAMAFPESLVVDRCGEIVVLRGGYDPTFAQLIGPVTVPGIVITCGTLVIEGEVVVQ